MIETLTLVFAGIAAVGAIFTPVCMEFLNKHRRLKVKMYTSYSESENPTLKIVFEIQNPNFEKSKVVSVGRAIYIEPGSVPFVFGRLLFNGRPINPRQRSSTVIDARHFVRDNLKTKYWFFVFCDEGADVRKERKIKMHKCLKRILQRRNGEIVHIPSPSALREFWYSLN